MNNIINLNNERKENEILQIMKDTSIFPLVEETEVGIANYTPIPVSRLAAYGTAFQPLVTAIQTIAGGAGGSGIYYVNTAERQCFR